MTNVRSLIRNCNALVMNLSLYSYDLVVLTETWLSSQNDLKPLLGNVGSQYLGIRCDRRSKKGGGVLLLLKKSFSYNVVFKESVANCYEILVCDLRIHLSEFRAICVYRTPDCNTSGSHQLAKAISDFSTTSLTSVLLGDFNLPDLMSHRPSGASKSFSEVVETHGFQHLVKVPTRRNSILDLVLCNNVGFIGNVVTGPPLGSSDHATVTFQLGIMPEREQFKWARDFNRADYNEIGSYLTAIDWIGILSSSSNVDQLYETFLAILHHAIDMYVPMRKTGDDAKGFPEYLIRMNRRCVFQWKKACASGRKEDWALYEALSSKANKALYRYNVFQEKKIAKSKDRTAFYRYVSSRIGKDNGVPSLTKDDGELASTESDKADLLGEVFLKAYNKDHIWGRDPLGEIGKDLPHFPQMNSTVWFLREEIIDVLSKWLKSFSLTPDLVPLSFIKNVVHYIAYPLEHIFNLSFMRAEVPVRWKHAFVTPIHKKGSRNDAKNYRPVSITSIFARTFEKILKKHVLAHLERHQIISDYQYGFLKGRSVETALLTSLNDWSKALEEKKCTDVVYFDFSKAFDKVPLEKLLIKMGAVGIHPMIMDWTRQFLSGRTYQVKIKCEFSKVFPALSGVPQGGVLSPLLFLLYTYELPGLINNWSVKCNMYADDVKIYKRIDGPEDSKTLQAAIDFVSSWAELWELPLSTEKTRLLMIGPKNQTRTPTYTINGDQLNRVNEARDLGYNVTSDLCFSQHCRILVKKANCRIYNLFRALKSKLPEVYIRAYKTYVRPIVESGTTVFNPTKKKDIDLLESVQNNFTRKLMMRCYSMNYSLIPRGPQRSVFFGLSSLRTRRKTADLLMMYKILANKLSINAQEFFEGTLTRSVRGKLKLRTSIARTRVRSDFLTYRILKDFNLLLGRYDDLASLSARTCRTYLA